MELVQSGAFLATLLTATAKPNMEQTEGRHIRQTDGTQAFESLLKVFLGTGEAVPPAGRTIPPGTEPAPEEGPLETNLKVSIPVERALESLPEAGDEGSFAGEAPADSPSKGQVQLGPGSEKAEEKEPEEEMPSAVEYSASQGYLLPNEICPLPINGQGEPQNSGGPEVDKSNTLAPIFARPAVYMGLVRRFGPQQHEENVNTIIPRFEPVAVERTARQRSGLRQEAIPFSGERVPTNPTAAPARKQIAVAQELPVKPAEPIPEKHPGDIEPGVQGSPILEERPVMLPGEDGLFRSAERQDGTHGTASSPDLLEALGAELTRVQWVRTGKAPLPPVMENNAANNSARKAGSKAQVVDGNLTAAQAADLEKAPDNIGEPKEAPETIDGQLEGDNKPHAKAAKVETQADAAQTEASRRRETPEKTAVTSSHREAEAVNLATVPAGETQAAEKPSHAQASLPLAAEPLDLSEPVEPGAGSELAERMFAVLNKERSEVRIQLKPDHLGELKIKVAVEQGVVSAEFITENQAVKNIIEAHLPELRSALQDLGTQVAELAVHVGTQGEPWQGRQHSEKPHWQAARKASGSLTAADNEAAVGAYLRDGWTQIDLRA